MRLDTKYYREQLQGRINRYITRQESGIELNEEEQRDLTHLKREAYYLDHKNRFLLKRANLRNIRRCLDDGVK